MTTTATRPLAMISGGTRGIGLAIAGELARTGYNLSLSFLRQKKAARAACAQLEALGARVLACKANVSRSADIASWLQQTRTTFADRPVQALILNAASGSLRPLADVDEQGWDWTFRINVWGAMACFQAVLPHLTAGSTVVALSSLGSQRPIPDYGLIGASKAALEAFVRQAAWEVGKKGIRVNAVSGGAVATGALDYFPDRDKILAAVEEHSPAPQPIAVDDIARAVAWLCRDESRGVQGQTLVVDGGYSLGMPGM